MSSATGTETFRKNRRNCARLPGVSGNLEHNGAPGSALENLPKLELNKNGV